MKLISIFFTASVSIFGIYLKYHDKRARKNVIKKGDDSAKKGLMFFEKSLDFFKFAVAFFHGKKGVKKRPREHCCVLGLRSFFSLRSINSTRREMCVNLRPALFLHYTINF